MRANFKKIASLAPTLVLYGLKNDIWIEMLPETPRFTKIKKIVSINI
jgi:hypothetical protein